MPHSKVPASARAAPSRRWDAGAAPASPQRHTASLGMDLAAFLIVALSATFNVFQSWGRAVPGTSATEAVQPVLVTALIYASAAIVLLWPSTYWRHR